VNAFNSLGWQIRDHLKKHRPKMFQDLQRQHGGQSRCASGDRKNGASRSGKAIFSKEG
jgi:hypothetical protein